MEGLAHPGSVCLSASAHEYAHRVLPLVVFEDLGPQLVKNLEMPIRVFMAPPIQAALVPCSSADTQGHNEFHSGRRFRTFLLHALVEVTQPEGLTPVEPAVFASLMLPALMSAWSGRADRCRSRKGSADGEAPKNRGLVIARPKEDDRRRHSFIFTPAGIELWQRLHPAILAASDRVMAPLRTARE